MTSPDETGSRSISAVNGTGAPVPPETRGTTPASQDEHRKIPRVVFCEELEDEPFVARARAPCSNVKAMEARMGKSRAVAAEWNNGPPCSDG